MKSVPNWDTLQQMVSRVSRASREYSTSLYASAAQIERWCANGEMRALISDNAVLAVRADQGFDRIYHVSKDLPSLRLALAQLPSGRYVADLIGRTAQLDGPCAAYAASGFNAYAVLRRMSRARMSGQAISHDGASVAHPDEAEQVALLLNDLLDPLSEQLPSVDTIRAAAIEGRLLIARRNTILSGMLMYDTQGQLAHLRFWHVHPDAQGLGVGRSLMNAFLSAIARAHRIVLWVMDDNERSIAIYRHYGFEVDGLIDRIMVLDKEDDR